MTAGARKSFTQAKVRPAVVARGREREVLGADRLRQLPGRGDDSRSGCGDLAVDVGGVEAQRSSPRKPHVRRRRSSGRSGSSGPRGFELRRDARVDQLLVVVQPRLDRAAEVVDDGFGGACLQRVER